MSFEGNNFINNNFFWFTGVVEDINDPMEMGRVRVRCYGYHTDDKNSVTGIPTESLPWGHVMMPITSASCSGIGESATGVLPGKLIRGKQTCEVKTEKEKIPFIDRTFRLMSIKAFQFFRNFKKDSVKTTVVSGD